MGWLNENKYVIGMGAGVIGILGGLYSTITADDNSIFCGLGTMLASGTFVYVSKKLNDRKENLENRSKLDELGRLTKDEIIQHRKMSRRNN